MRQTREEFFLQVRGSLRASCWNRRLHIGSLTLYDQLWYACLGAGGAQRVAVRFRIIVRSTAQPLEWVGGLPAAQPPHSHCHSPPLPRFSWTGVWR